MTPVQGLGRPRRGLRALANLAACLLLTACGNTLNGPIDLFHDLEGGEIAANRPPPPGEGEPFPKLGTVPPKPVVADSAYRTALSTQLAAERDTTERVAADTPIQAVPPPPPPVPPIAPPTTGASTPANAVLDTAEASPAATAAAPRAANAVPSANLSRAADIGPAPGSPLIIAGAPGDASALPDIPAAPPPPATFEGVAAEPAPTIRTLPAHLTTTAGTPVFFPPASAVLPPSQAQTLRDFVGHRGGHGVEILGRGDAASDTPDGQATAIALGLARAHSVAAALAALHVPQASLRVGADAFGRGAVLRLLP